MLVRPFDEAIVDLIANDGVAAIALGDDQATKPHTLPRRIALKPVVPREKVRRTADHREMAVLGDPVVADFHIIAIGVERDGLAILRGDIRFR